MDVTLTWRKTPVLLHQSYSLGSILVHHKKEVPTINTKMTILSPQNTNLGLNGALHFCQLVQQKVRYMYMFAKPMTINCTSFGKISLWKLEHWFIKKIVTKICNKNCSLKRYNKVKLRVQATIFYSNSTDKLEVGIAPILPPPPSRLQGCALRKIEGSPVLWTCKIQGALHMICMKNLRFSSRPGAKVRRQGPPGSTRA